MNKIVKICAVLSAAAGLSLASTGVAHANSFTKSVYGGKVWYNDGQDKVCAETTLRYADIKVGTGPYDASRGPSFEFTDPYGGGATCRSLATAYEDTRYRMKIVTGGVAYLVDYYS